LFLMVLWLSACSTTPSKTDQAELKKEFNRAVVAFQAQRYVDALSIFRPMAEDGLPGGQYFLGLHYEFGFGVEKDLQHAINLFQLASEQHYGAAEHHMAVLYLEGVLEQKNNEGLKWLTRAVEHGYYPAYGRMGYLYEHSLGVEPDVQKAIRFYQLGSERKDKFATTNLAKLFYFGDKIKQDYIKSARLFAIATELGHNTAQYFLGVQFMYGFGIESNQPKAVILYRQAADQGHLEAQNALGVAYANGTGITQDHVQAVHWYQIAAKGGYAEAQFNLGTRYEKGLGVEKDQPTAISWYVKAAKQNHSKAAFNMALLLLEGGKVENINLGLKWLNLAAEQGLHHAEYLLGSIYYKGEKISQDFSAALKWFRIAAENNNPSAQYMLAVMHEKGQGVEHDIGKAKALYEKVSRGSTVEAVHARKWLAALHARNAGETAGKNYNLSLQKLREGNAVEAEQLLRTAVKLKTDFVEAYTMLGVALGMQGKFVESTEILKKAIDVNSRYADAHANLGFSFAKLGNWQESVKYLKQALAIDPNHARAKVNLDKALRMLDSSKRINRNQ